jgi:riboflavin kinase/FMN adenylyltransferase
MTRGGPWGRSAAQPPRSNQLAWGLDAAARLGGFAPSVVTVGMFDGVHVGHRALLAQVRSLARARGVASVAVTFDRHPLRVVRPDAVPPLLTSLRHRVALLEAAGADRILMLRFTPAASRQRAEEFAEQVLFGLLGARAIVAGGNFRFGHRAAGDVALLARLGAPRGVEVVEAELASVGGRPVSSTRVREALGRGDVAAAAALLGRPFAVAGRVGRGDRRGRALLGVPTANLRLPRRLLVPAAGIYAGRLSGGPLRRPMPAAVNVGVNPTFGGTDLRVEAHVLDVDVDLYGRRVTVEFEHRLRPERRFDSVQELVAEMHADIAMVRRLLAAR